MFVHQFVLVRPEYDWYFNKQSKKWILTILLYVASVSTKKNPSFSATQLIFAHCPLPIANCPLPNAHCPLPIAHCPFSIPRFSNIRCAALQTTVDSGQLDVSLDVPLASQILYANKWKIRKINRASSNQATSSKLGEHNHLPSILTF